MSVIKSGIWFVKGLKEYTKGGFLSASKHFNATDLNVNKSDISFMVTGANSGLGKEAALEIAKRGGTVHIVCRNKERGEQALQDIISTSGNQNVHLHQLDTSRPKDIYRFVQSFQSQGHSLDVLINNAGCMVNTREVTEEGYEVNFATNTLGTHILTTALVPLLSKSSQPRVIIVSSGGMLTTNLNIDDLRFEKMKPFDGTMAYAQNKRQQIVMTEQYAKQYPNIHFSSMHPGWADTPAVRTSMPEFYEKMKNRLRTTEQGADTIVWLAVSDAALSQPSGLFFQDRKNVPTYLPLTWSRSTQEQDKTLMSQLEEIAKKFQSLSTD